MHNSITLSKISKISL